jgi:putative restriction endonuclease
VQLGTTYPTREALRLAGVHRAPIAGIVGTAVEGAESIVLGGGYVDDEDLGAVVIYTGQGGNDPNTHRQIADQELTRGNLALVRSEDEGLPVRVVRSVPGRGGPYRYDGLYRVASHWHEVGRDGFRVYRYRLEELALDGSARDVEVPVPIGEFAPGRRRGEVQRVVRLTAVGRWVKTAHDDHCQMCGVQLVTGAGGYSEAAHIRPVGRPHDGPDVVENVLCLCPNHHVLFDKGAVGIAEDLSLIGMPACSASLQAMLCRGTCCPTTGRSCFRSRSSFRIRRTAIRGSPPNGKSGAER